jgi:hypothetical protein
MALAVLDRQRQRASGGGFGQVDLLREARRRPSAETECSSLFGVVDHGASTLDDLITGAWNGVLAREAVRCPVCRGSMVSSSGPQGEVQSGDCLECGASLF